MELTGTILQIGTTKEYGSNNFKKRELVLSTDEQYPQKILIEFVQDKCQVLDKYKKDDGVSIRINIKGREWTNKNNEVKFFNSIQGWKIEKAEMKKELQLADQNEDRENDLPF
jgi:hypothetical protein